MKENTFIFTTGITGINRKDAAGLIAGYFGTEAICKSAPGFEYIIPDNKGGEWQVDKKVAVTTPELETGNLADAFEVFVKLSEAGVSAENCRATVTLPLADHNGVTLRNLINIVASKEALLKKALGVERELLDAEFVEGINNKRLVKTGDFADALDELGKGGCPGFSFDFEQGQINLKWFNGSLEKDKITTFIQLALAINQQALVQKHSTPRATVTDNEKYTFRVWLLRLGFIGDKYKTSRKILLSSLSGNGSFKKNVKKDDPTGTASNHSEE